ncbi:MAG: hypothetical protein U0X92_11520 [Anaerolineales bacterium]
MDLPIDRSAPTDFDFFIGSWKVSHRRLKVRLANSDEWETFAGVCVTQKTLGGFGNIDDNTLEIPSGAYRAMTIRSFDVKTGAWSIWWLDGRNPGRLDVPVVGKFEKGVGTFIAEDTWEGKPLRVRFLWTQSQDGSPHWEQAFSLDAGATWETNWVMDFTRSE